MKVITLFLFAGLCAIAAPRLVSVDGEGKPLACGGGYDFLHSTTVTAVVYDDGRAAFIAKMPETSAFEGLPLQGTYLTSADGSKSTLVYEGYDEDAYKKASQMLPSLTPVGFACSNWSLTAGSSRDRLLVLEACYSNSFNTEGTMSLSIKDEGTETALIKDKSKSEILNYKLASNGSTAIVYSSAETLCYQRTGDGWNSKSVPSLPTNNLHSVAFAGKDSVIYYTRDNEEGDCTLYRLDSDGETKNICVIGNGAVSSIPISAASNAEVVTFVSNNGSQVASPGYFGSQVVLLDYTGSSISTRQVAPEQYYDCTSPSIDASGRYVTFAAKPEKNADARQIYRYDVLLDNTVLVSSPDGTVLANQDCASPAISPNGRYVTFSSQASNLSESTLVDGKAVHTWIVDLGVSETLAVEHVSRKSDGTLSNAQGFPLNGGMMAVSDDGEIAVFSSNAALTDSGKAAFIYLRRLTGANSAIKVLANNLDLDQLKALQISGDGSTILWIYNGKVFACKEAEPYQLLELEKCSSLSCNADGSVLALTADGKPYLWNGDGLRCLNDSKTGCTQAYLSRDGLFAAFLDSTENQLDFWTARDGYNTWSTGIQSASLSFSGAQAAVITTEKNAGLLQSRLGMPSPEPLPLPLDVSSSELAGLTLAPNASCVIYKKNASPYQGYRMLLNQETATETLLTDSASEEPNGYVQASFACSADASVILFASTTNQLIPEKTDTYKYELYARFMEDASAAPLSVAAESQFENDDATELLFELSKNSSQDALVSLNGEASVGRASVCPPSLNTSWCSLAIADLPKHFCGSLTVPVTLFNGDTEIEQDVTLEITNVNDAPSWKQTVFSGSVNEGSTLALDLTEWADDPDLLYKAITDEALTFSVIDAPEWLSATPDGVLTLKPGYGVSSKAQNAQVAVSVVVTDKAGETATMELRITVVNVNQAPCIVESPDSVTEGQVLNWTDFQFSDDECTDNLKLEMVCGEDSRRLSKADFPWTVVHFNANDSNKATYQLSVIDEEDAQSTAVSLVVELKKVEVSTTGSDGLGWETLTATADGAPGWHLLSLPFQASTDAISASLQATEIWIWNKDHYEVSAGTLSAGQGFMVFASPVTTDSKLSGQRMNAENTYVPSSGWNLVGPETVKQEGTVLTKKSRRYVAQQPVSGEGAWNFDPPCYKR